MVVVLPDPDGQGAACITPETGPHSFILLVAYDHAVINTRSTESVLYLHLHA
jgi:hypothetical protein